MFAMLAKLFKLFVYVLASSLSCFNENEHEILKNFKNFHHPAIWWCNRELLQLATISTLVGVPTATISTGAVLSECCVGNVEHVTVVVLLVCVCVFLSLRYLSHFVSLFLGQTKSIDCFNVAKHLTFFLVSR